MSPQGVMSRLHPRIRHEGPEGEQKYRSTLSLTSALYGDGWLTSHSSHFTPGMTQYPLYRRLDRPQGGSGWVQKICPYQDLIPEPSSL